MKDFVYELRASRVAIAASPLPPPVVTYLTDEKTWRLEEPYTYPDGAHRIHVPAGFRFDLASIPRPLWWLIAPFELSIAAPLVHDFLYRYRGEPPPGSIEPPRTYTRKETDRLFRRIMREEGVVPWRCALAYRAVRLFGAFAWGHGGP